MSLENSPEDPRRGATTAQLRADIDAGRTGDKIAGFDPAASPLGTDEEAGGEPHDPELVAKVRAQETRGAPDSAHQNAATPELQPDGRLRRGSVVVPALLGVIAAVALAAIVLAQL